VVKESYIMFYYNWVQQQQHYMLDLEDLLKVLNG